MWAGVQRKEPAALPPGRARYPLYRRLGGHNGRYDVGALSDDVCVHNLTFR